MSFAVTHEITAECIGWAVRSESGTLVASMKTRAEAEAKADELNARAPRAIARRKATELVARKHPVSGYGKCKPGDFDIALGDNIRAERKAAGLTQNQLIDRIGIARSSFLKIESGKSCTTVKTLARIARALGVTASALIP